MPLGHEMTRPSWDQVWLEVADRIAERSSCLRPKSKMAVVFTDSEYAVISTGVVGAPRLLPNCREAGCLMIEGHCRRTVHAEINGILQAGRSARSLVGATAYVTARPCIVCSVAMIQAGVERVVYRRHYDTEGSHDALMAMYAQARVRLEQWEERSP